MFGIFRTALATFVVLEHLGTAPYLGTYAVFGFYILSGYLMTRIMQKTYGYTLRGLGKYFTNRFLRIYPIYWVSILLSFFLIYLTSEELTRSVNTYLYYPTSSIDFLSNVFITFTPDSEPRLTPPAWALTTELFFYILIALGISKNIKLTALWLLASLFYTIYLVYVNASFSYRYFTISAASLPFSIGAMIFFVQQKFRIKKPLNLSLAITTIIFLNYLLNLNYQTSHTYGFYFNLTLCALLIFCLTEVKPNYIRIDKSIGNLSYPIYLIHYQCGIIAFQLLYLFDLKYNKGDFIFFTTSIIITLILAYIISTTVEQKIETIRNKIRPSSKIT